MSNTDKGITKEKVLDVGVDTLYFVGTKYILHYGVDAPHVKNLNGGDVGVFITADGVYHLFFRGYFDLMPFGDKAYDCEVNKWGAVMAGMTLLNLATGRKERILDNLISSGVAGIASLIVDSLRGKGRCV